MKKELTPIRAIPKHLPTQVERQELGELEEDDQLRQYGQLILKYRTLIFACVSLVMFLMLIYAFTVTPEYTASSKIRISTYQPLLTATKIEDALQERSKERHYLETQIQEIKSFSLADRVLDNTQIRESFTDRSSGLFSKMFSSEEDRKQAAANSEGYEHPIEQIKKYLKSISVEPVRRTALVVINATAIDAKLAALMANRHAQEYIDWVRDSWIEQQSHSLRFLKRQASELREKVVDLEREMADYAEVNSIIAVNKDENITVQKMAQLNQLLTEVTAKRIQDENNYQEALASSKSGISAAFDDPSVQTMRSELATLEAEYGQFSAKFTDSYPKMKQLKNQISGLKRSIKGQRQQIIRGLQLKARASVAEEKRLTEKLEMQKSKAFELAKREVQYNVLNRELSTSRELLQNVLRQIKEMSLAVEGKSSNVSLVDYAIAPKEKSFPNKKLLLALGLCLGLSLGVGVAFLLDHLDNTIHTPEESSQILRIANLGVVPSFGIEEQRENKANKTIEYNKEETQRPERALIEKEYYEDRSPSVMFVKEPQSLASEAYRTIRTGILLSQAGEPPRTILVSSAQSSEGKTTSTLNLAASLAGAGARVALIDGDLRRPSIAEYFNLMPGLPGVVEIITGQASINDVGVKDVIKRVTLIPSGKMPPNPAELLGSIEMASLIDQLSLAYDYVLIDSPPILPVTDAVILSRYVDGVVLVVKGAVTPKKVVLDAKKRLEAVGAKFLGTILNDIDITSGDYYYYNRYYNSYYQKESFDDGSQVFN